MRRFSQIMSILGQMLLIVLIFALTALFLTHVAMTFSLGTGESYFYAIPIDLFALLLLLVIHIMLLGVFIGNFNRQRLLRAAREGDTAILPECEQQPSLTATLAAGEVLVMERVSPLRTVLRSISSSLGGVLVGGAILELGVIPISATLGPWFGDHLFPSFDPMPLPTLGALDWLTLGYSLALVLVVWLANARTQLAQRRWQVRADDLGLTLRVGRRRTALAWNQIQTIMRAQGSFNPNNVAGTYQIIDRDGRFVPLVIDKAPLTAAEMARFTYLGGYERYQAEAQRLLATICARSVTTLHYSTFGSKLRRRIQQNNPQFIVSNDTIATSPVAGAEWQPAILAAPATFEKIEVKPRLSGRKILGQGAMIEGFIIGFIVLLSLFDPTSHRAILSGLNWQSLFTPPLNEISTHYVVGIIMLFLLLLLPGFLLLFGMGFVYAYSLQQKYESQLILTEEGVKNFQKQGAFQPSIIPWKDIYVWLVIPAKSHHHDDIYVIFYGNQHKMFWRNSPEKQLAGRRVYGDRHAAYQERLQAAHAIIAARTGLPLRMVKFDA